MSNTPNEDPYSNSGSAQNSGNSPSSSNYGLPPQDPYGTTPSYPPPPEYFNSSQNPQEQYGTPSNYQQGQYGAPPNYPPPGYSSMAQGQQIQYGAPSNYPPPPVYAGGPQGPYGYATSDQSAPPASKPLPLGDAIRQLPGQYIRVLTKPGAATFAAEQGKAAWNIVWVQIGILTLFSVLFGFAFSAFGLNSFYNIQNLPASTADIVRGFFSVVPFSYILLTPLGLFISVGIYHLFAKAFGGRGTFLPYMYSYLLFNVPLTLIAYLVVLIPILGTLVSFAISIYSIVLQVFMTMAVHRLSGGRATLAVLILPIIVTVLAIVFFIVVIALVAAAVQHAR